MNHRIRPNVARMHGYVPGEQPDHPDVIKLNTNENPYPPAPAVRSLFNEPPERWLRLYPDPVFRKLRQALAELHGCSLDHVFCGNGSDEILSLCIRAFVPSDGTIGYFEPSYSLYPVLAEAADVPVQPIPLNQDFTCPPPADSYDASLFFWTNPNAPTSLRVGKEGIEAFAQRSEGVVVVDEAYVDFADADCVSLALTHPNVLVTRTFSKSCGLAGIRLGYAIGHPELVEALFKIKDAYNINRLTQELGVVAVAEHAYMRETVARIVQTRERIGEALSERGYKTYPSQTNFLWVQPPDGVEAATLYDKLRSANVFVRYFPGPVTGQHLRITIGTDSQMDTFLTALDSLCPLR